MEDELWTEVYRIVMELGKAFRCKRVQHSTRRIVLVYLWAVLHDRPVSWACRDRNWPADQHTLPSPSCMSRRLRTSSVEGLLRDVQRQLRECFPPRICRWIDAKPLPIGGSTRDPDARYGRAAGTMAKGYKLHVICSSAGALEAWSVLPINVNEKRAARDLVREVGREGYLVGDNQYDSNPLYNLAGEHGQQLLSPRRPGTSLGHHRHSAYRLRANEMMAKPLGQTLLTSRTGIERFFAHLTSFPGGLSPLPNWVRRLHRVRLWVQAKLIFNAVRLTKRLHLRQ